MTGNTPKSRPVRDFFFLQASCVSIAKDYEPDCRLPGACFKACSIAAQGSGRISLSLATAKRQSLSAGALHARAMRPK
jgi:hypothetical protein